MTYAGISAATSSVADMVHAQFRDGVVNALSTIRELEVFEQFKTGLNDAPNEAETFSIMIKEGFESVMPATNGSRSLPSFADVDHTTGKYFLKRYNSCLEFSPEELELLDQGYRSGANLSSGSYISAAEHVDSVLMAKQSVLMHKILVDLYSDGTGIVGTVTAKSESGIASGIITITLSAAYNARGSANWMRTGAKLLVASNAGVAMTSSTDTTIDSLEITSFDISTGVVTCNILNSSGTVITPSATSIAATDVVYFGTKAQATAGKITLIDTTAITSATELDTISDHIVGLRGLVRADGQKVQGMTRSGLLASIVKDCSGAALRPTHLSALIALMKRRWHGFNQYKFDSFLIADEVLDYLIVSAQSDRRLVGAPGNGVPAAFGSGTFELKESFTNGQSWNFINSVFVPFQDIYLLPKKIDGIAAPISMPFSDMKPIFNGSESVGGVGNFLPKPATGGYENAVLQYENMRLGLFSRMPAALGKATNFALS